MSSSNNRFGRRTDRQNDDLRAEPVLSFNKRPAARDGQSDPVPSDARKPQAGQRLDRADSEATRFGRDAQRDPIPSFLRGSQPGPRVDREDAREFGLSFGEDDEPGSERDDDFDPRVRRERALEQRVPEAERPLYHHLFDEQENRRRGLGWLAALGSVAVIAIGAAFAWNNFMDRPAPAGLYEPPGFASHGNSGYTTPTQPTTDANTGSDTGSKPSPLAATPPNSTNSPAVDQQATKDIAAMAQPKSVPSEPPPPPKKTISEAAADPGSLGAAANPAPPPPPEATKEPAVAPAPFVAPPPPKRETAKTEAKHEAPRKEASITPPRPAPAPASQDTAPQDATEPATAPAESAPPPRPRSRAAQNAAPPAVTEPAAAPAESAPPPRPRSRTQATGQPQRLNRNPPANYGPAPQQAPQQQQPSFATRSPPPQQQESPFGNAGPPPGTPDTVTVDGVTYVNGQEPHSLGTLSGPPQAASNDAGMPPYAPPMPLQAPPPAYTARPYTPSDHEGGAPLPNDVVILPNGQMAVPYGR